MADEKTWRDRLVRASFRGFEFLTDSHDAKGGRRLVVHEFPGADEPLVEDLGGKAWDYKLTAYFIGPNYDLERNGFLAKLAEPGADWLTHPWLGYLWVRAHSWSVHESNDKGGYCAVSLEFVPGGEQPFTSEPDRVDVAYERVRKFAEAAVDDFDLEPMSANGLTAFIAAVQSKLEILRTVLALATLPLTWANQVINLVQGIKTDIAALLALPAAYAAAWNSLCNVLGFGPDDDTDGGDSAAGAGRPGVSGTGDITDTDRPRVVRRLVSAAGGKPVALTGVAATDGVVRRNLIREDALRRRLVLASAARIALADYRAAEDRDAVLTAVVDGIDAALPGMPDPVFQAAVSLRTALIEALLAQDLAPATWRDVVAPLPAVVLAHRMQIDEDVLRARNKVRHPLFVKGRVCG